ncbi:hypothetical protein G5C66_04095 [Nocardioides sp. KC13]|uniref:DUF6199 domain-containing protein n=1 Tax=Nocardioides turkmenicus TaxID=2711220 RepID=A0A6M1QVW9_9ACTN|nr:DUF6199 family natural product biosynthesis protein [Nocardioides sp. KC13]NGN91916.1 hypothetical protein [Nocardioides sp. KC13]
MLLAIICVLGAAWSFFVAARPDVGFFLEEGWKFRDAEPSDLYLGVTRFGAAVTGIACLVFAAIFAFSGPSDTVSPPTERADPSPTRSGPAVTVTARPPSPEQAAKKKAKEQCQDLLPLIEDEAEWNPQGKLANRDHVSSIVAYQQATMTLESRPDGDLVTIRSDLPTVDKFVRPLVTMTSSSATCVANKGD